MTFFCLEIEGKPDGFPFFMAFEIGDGHNLPYIVVSESNTYRL